MVTLRLAISPGQDEAAWHLQLSVRTGGDAVVDEATAVIQLAVQTHTDDEIRWYLEEFLEDGSGPARIRADAARRAIRELGAELFRAVFKATSDTDRIWSRVKANLHDVRAEIDSADVGVGHVPWELMHDPEFGVPLALSARSFVRTCPIGHSPVITEAAPVHGCRVLLIISRPEGGSDVSYRSIASKLFLSLHGNPAFSVKVLRPPTFSECARALRDAKSEGRPYDILHFDGHGFHAETATPNAQGIVGLRPGAYIVFEDEGTGEPTLSRAAKTGGAAAPLNLSGFGARMPRLRSASPSRANGSSAGWKPRNPLRWRVSSGVMSFSSGATGGAKRLPRKSTRRFVNGSLCQQVRNWP
jgi:hypothetical protein